MILNLMINAMDAMRLMTHMPKEIVISAQQEQPGAILLSVEDSGEASTPAWPSVFLSRSLQRSERALGWAFPSAVPSSSRTAGGCGPQRVPREVQYSGSPFRWT